MFGDISNQDLRELPREVFSFCGARSTSNYNRSRESRRSLLFAYRQLLPGIPLHWMKSEQKSMKWDWSYSQIIVPEGPLWIRNCGMPKLPRYTALCNLLMMSPTLMNSQTSNNVLQSLYCHQRPLKNIKQLLLPFQTHAKSN